MIQLLESHVLVKSTLVLIQETLFQLKIDNSFEGLRDCLLAPQSIDEISEGVKLLQKGFTTDRDKSIENYLSDPKLVSAYTTFYLPSNLKKVRFFIDQNLELLNSG